MFSIMTMASSTTKPVEITSAISVRLLIEKPASDITPKVPTSDSGTATAGISVAGTLRRNTKITATTSAIASSSSICASRTEARIVVVRSREHAHVDRAGQRGLQLRQHRLHAVDRLDHVGAGLALHVEDDRGRVVGPRRQTHVLRVVDQRRDVAQPHRVAVLVGEHQVGVLGRALHLVVGVDRRCAQRAVEAALGLAHVGRADGVAQVVERQAERGQRLRVGAHAHRGPLPAGDADQPHARQLRDLLRQAAFHQVVHARSPAASARSRRGSGSAHRPG